MIDYKEEPVMKLTPLADRVDIQRSVSRPQ